MIEYRGLLEGIKETEVEGSESVEGGRGGRVCSVQAQNKSEKQMNKL